MTPAWTQRQEELLSDCVVPPDVFHHMVDRLGEFVTPYQHALKTEAANRAMTSFTLVGHSADFTPSVCNFAGILAVIFALLFA